LYFSTSEKYRLRLVGEAISFVKRMITVEISLFTTVSATITIGATDCALDKIPQHDFLVSSSRAHDSVGNGALQELTASPFGVRGAMSVIA
jgi:hypothetical protein